MSRHCQHTRKQLVWGTHNTFDLTPFVNKQLRYQCLDCGDLPGGQVAHSQARPDTPTQDIELTRRGIEERERYWRQHQDERAEHDRRWRENYENHLQSGEWQNLRELVFEREQRVCQGCRRYRATDVHHATYKHVGNEFCFELLALCRGCHARYHGHEN